MNFYMNRSYTSEVNATLAQFNSSIIIRIFSGTAITAGLLMTLSLFINVYCTHGSTVLQAKISDLLLHG